MNYLSFQPAFDVFHTEFRFLRLRRIMSADAPWHYDQLRIVDFYLLFFFRIKGVRLSPKHKSMRKLARDISEIRYERQPDDHVLFSRMERTQNAAIGTLVAGGYFDAPSFKGERVVETEQIEPQALSSRIDLLNERDVEVMQSLQSLVTEYDLLGPDGLKARTGLLEHRYDAI